MRIVRIRLFQYRNLRNQDITPGAGITLFSGLNGQGKTNILEAVYFLAYGRSFHTSVPRDCVRHGESLCRVEGVIERGSLQKDVALAISGTEKKMFVVGKPAPLNEFVGNLHLLAFTHEHLDVVRGGPADRRAFLDRAMVSLYPGHIAGLAAYSRALKQRNNILCAMRDGKTAYEDRIIDAWDEALVRSGSRVLSNRLKYVESMKRELPGGLFGEEDLKIHYLSSLTDDADISRIEEKFREKIWSVREKDRYYGHTSVGPHRDDLKLYVNGKSLMAYGSSGQQRSGLLSLYFSQMEIHFKTQGFYPVFMVDDAEAELDEERLRTFLGYLSSRTQTLLTSTRNFLIDSSLGDILHFEVKGGEVSKFI
ncbi:MAG: DNA replication and repair protein RecF [Acidobacteria bacterium]|nr:DNA replication and repair protein RecF [Acidobacteriota bacterium]